MKRANIIVFLVSAYVLIVFSWWIYTIYENIYTLYEQQVKLTEYKCYEATFEMERLRDGDLFADTVDAKNHFYSKYPELELIFIDSVIPLNGFMIRPALSTYLTIERNYKRNFILYMLEGLIMVMILLWGINRIYSTFKKSIELQRQQSNFLLSVTHELKTPIASIKLYLDTLKRRKLNEEQTATILNNSYGDIVRLQNLAENLLLSAQLEGKKYTLDKSYINLSELLTQLVQKFTGPRALENNVFTDIEPDVYGNFDKNALEMIFYNLLNNAVKYADNIPEITVKLKKDKDFVEISFADKGIGISDEDKKLIFQKFYRIGNENIRKTKGTGLGLYIVHNLVQLHNGEINVQNNVPRGCVFIIKLPLK